MSRIRKFLMLKNSTFEIFQGFKNVMYNIIEISTDISTLESKV